MFTEISQNSQENTCAKVSFLIKLQASGSSSWKQDSCKIPEVNIELNYLNLKMLPSISNGSIITKNRYTLNQLLLYGFLSPISFILLKKWLFLTHFVGGQVFCRGSLKICKYFLKSLAPNFVFFKDSCKW